LVVAGIGAIGWGASSYARRRRSVSGVDLARIDVLAVRSLGGSHRLAVVEVGDRRLLVGMGKETIASIADLTDAPAFEETLQRELPAERRDDGKQLLQSIGRFEGLDV
jgi:flagellar biogenesis protein FliO